MATQEQPSKWLCARRPKQWGAQRLKSSDSLGFGLLGPEVLAAPAAASNNPATTTPSPAANATTAATSTSGVRG